MSRSHINQFTFYRRMGQSEARSIKSTPSNVAVSSFPTLLIVLTLFCFGLTIALFIAACGGPAQPGELETYRIQIGSKQFTFKQQMMYVIVGLELYRLHVGAYPSNDNNLDALLSPPEIADATGDWRGPYAVSPSVFYDPWGRKLEYARDEKGKLELRSLGKDGAIGDDDIDARTFFPDFFRELDRIPQLGPTPILSATNPSPSFSR